MLFRSGFRSIIFLTPGFIKAMKKLVFVILAAFFAFAFFAARQGAERDPSHVFAVNSSPPIPQSAQAVAFGISERLGEIARVQPSDKRIAAAPSKVVELGLNLPSARLFQNFTSDRDGAIASTSAVPMPPHSLSFNGLSNYDNVSVYELLIIPPDMTGDVGPNHYVQAVNSLIRVYDKKGSPVSAPVRISSIFAPLGTACAERNDGLPNVQYDTLADRWLISQVCSNFPPFRQMIAVSKTSDPAGQYFIYEFVMPNVKINDFPKFGVWPDAYYMSTDEFLGAEYVGAGAFAFDRTKMLAGDPAASYVYFNLPVVQQIRRGGLLPSDLDGLRPPPTGSPNIFASYTATEYGDAQDAVRLFNFHVYFTNPANSTFTERPESPIAVAAFDPTSPDGRPDITQPPPGERLDSISDRLNHRLAYRNFGTHESLVVNQTVRTTPVDQPYRAGVRVYELRRAGGGFSPHEHTTIGDAVYSRWIAAAAQDNAGNIAVEYNRVSDDKKPSILYSGKLATEPQGAFRPEEMLIEGTGVQKGFGWRWGEYSGLNIDPIDDCTFWMTNAYYTLASQDFSDFGWLTRIGRFKFDECTAAPRGTITGVVTNSVTLQGIANAKITATAYSRGTDSIGSYGNLTVLPGTYNVTASANGFRSQTVTVTVANGQTLTQNFSLQPIPVLQNTANEITAESCGINQAVEPGETVTLNISLRNTGSLPTQNLIATLQSAGGIINAGPPQSYGTLPVGGSVVARPFSFTVSPAVLCGGVVTLTLNLQDGAENFGTVSFDLRAGEVRYAFRENFDGVTAPNLPLGWTTSSSANHQLWRTSSTRNQTAPNSVFSPAPHQQGMNELISPIFSVTTPNAEINFRNWYELETTFLRNRLYDGSVLEVKIGISAWQDILAAGGTFLSGGYDGVIDGCCQNPLAGRLGWSGRSGLNQTSEFITTRAKLPASAAGQNVQLRWRIGSDIGGFREGQYIDNLAVADGYSCSCALTLSQAPFDFDGDGKTDLSVFNLIDASSEPDFRILNSSNNALRAESWGSSGDLPANADFDGDGKTDLAVFRPSNGTWYVLRSSNSSVSVVNFGLVGDRPVPADFDGDSKADIAVFRQQPGSWFVLRSSDGQFFAQAFGTAGDHPVPADYDGDGRADIAVFRSSTGVWYISRSSDSGFFAAQFGTAGDRPVAGDFDGDDRADLVVFRPNNGTWYLLRSNQGFTAFRFGLSDDKPLQADFDGDGKNDIAVFRQADRVWYYIRSSDGSFAARQFGLSGENPVPGIYVNQ